MNVREAILALESNEDAKAIAGIQFLTSHLKKTSKNWRDLVAKLPSKARSNRLDATISLIDRPNVNEALVAMRKATGMMAKHGLAWSVIFEQESGTKPKNETSSGDAGSSRTWGQAGKTYADNYDYCDDYYWQNKDWLREATQRVYEKYNQRENQKQDKTDEENSTFSIYEKNVEKAYQTYDLESEKIMMERMQFEMESRLEKEKLLTQLREVIRKDEKANELFDERQEVALNNLKNNLKLAKIKAQAGTSK